MDGSREIHPTPGTLDHIANLGCIFPQNCIHKGDHLQCDCALPGMVEQMIRFVAGQKPQCWE